MMRTLLAILILACPGLLCADTGDGNLPPADQRAIRELQNRAYGAPTLPQEAPKPESLLALAELGATASSSDVKQLHSDDYAALFALLQRYRDDLLKMGMDATELQAELGVLEARAKELESRLDALKPRDGLKIFGRFYSVFDDLHVLGNGSLPGVAALAPVTAGTIPKPAGSGVRTQLGVVHNELTLEGTRGPASGFAQVDIVIPWGAPSYVDQVDIRRAQVQLRLPITFEIGNVDAFLTPLTLWRNDSVQPFEPSLFAERRQRMEDDLLLKPNAWDFTGVRAKTDARLFNSLLLQIQSLTGFAAIAYQTGGQGLPSPVAGTIYQEGNAADTVLVERYNTYLQGWEISVPINKVTLAYDGMLFWDVPSTGPLVAAGSLKFESMSELVQSGGVKFSSGGFTAEAEGALSSYQPPYQVFTPQASLPALTGTAFTGSVDWAGTQGHISFFGRMVSDDFHASGAQGRSVDYTYQYLGPFLTEQSQVGPNGILGVNGGNIPLSDASRLNDVLIPPGVLPVPNRVGFNMAPAGSIWQNLLAYGPGEEIDPYGAATPNREGGGVDASWKWFDGVLQPTASAEMSSNLDPVTNTAAVFISPFSMSRYRAGLMVDLGPALKWPLRFGGGFTMTSDSNGKQDPAGMNYTMTTQLMDASAQWNAGKPIGMQIGYRHMVATGEDDMFDFNQNGTVSDEIWDVMGAGVWWRPSKTISLDLVTTVGHTTVPLKVSQNLEVDQNVARLTLEF
jgi:hypothetical protein